MEDNFLTVKVTETVLCISVAFVVRKAGNDFLFCLTLVAKIVY